MKMKSIFCLSLFVVALSINTFATRTVEELSSQAASEDYSSAMTAIRELRTMGQVGLDALFVKYAADIDKFAKTGDATDEWKRIANALDTVAMQKDAYASRLYWYTNLDDAKRIAKQKNKPILTLRLLGNLNEEFSCANSRLFRALLYPNAEISRYLRDNYILHWQSVRPAPRITIDFGDGRKIERTITGNSIHYILDKDGEIIDAIPGLYSPVAFMKYVTQGAEMNKALSGLPNEKHAIALMKYRKAAFDQIIQKRNKTIETSGVNMTETRGGTLAILAAPMAVAKMVVVDEYSILRVYDDFAKFEAAVNFDDWNKLSKLYSPNLKIDENSVRFIRRQNAKTGLSEDEFAGLFAKLENFVALDTTRNDFLFHTKLYEWLNRNRGSESLDNFNARVYDVIFKTPNYDKWLGLYSTDVYTALDGNGFVK
ncbi:MAG: hypothetical protein WBD16_07410 [Pyrinomonadaceae bacterium]